ncbi:GNAT family N-acetyltransferase [Jatrophihabitans sp. DSM 45814]
MTTIETPDTGSGRSAGADAALESAASPGSGLHPLDNPAYASLTGPHAHFAERCGNVLRYPVDVSPFMALPPYPDAQDWADALALVGPGAMVPLGGVFAPPPVGWDVVIQGAGVQLVDDGIAAAPDSEAVRLTAADVPEMLALIERTKPGPFLPRTIELGTYLGIRRRGELVAMAGERLHPPGWTEISAVCTDAAYRGEGLATRLVHAVAHGIRERGETPFLHAVADNLNAIRLYESLGFRLRRTATFQAAKVPGDLAAP